MGNRHIKILFIFAFLLSCAKSDYDEIVEVLSKREKALKNKDIKLYMECISENFLDNGKNYFSIKKRIENLFKTFDEIKLKPLKREIFINKDEAVVLEDFLLYYKIENEYKIQKGKEKLFLKKEKGRWRIIKGI